MKNKAVSLLSEEYLFCLVVEEYMYKFLERKRTNIFK